MLISSWTWRHLRVATPVHRLVGNRSISASAATDVYKKVRKAAWESFARFGMGANAKSVDAEMTGITADTSLPADLRRVHERTPRNEEHRSWTSHAISTAGVRQCPGRRG
jgi:hypothetical protein